MCRELMHAPCAWVHEMMGRSVGDVFGTAASVPAVPRLRTGVAPLGDRSPAIHRTDSLPCIAPTRCHISHRLAAMMRHTDSLPCIALMGGPRSTSDAARFCWLYSRPARQLRPAHQLHPLAVRCRNTAARFLTRRALSTSSARRQSRQHCRRRFAEIHRRYPTRSITV